MTTTTTTVLIRVNFILRHAQYNIYLSIYYIMHYVAWNLREETTAGSQLLIFGAAYINIIMWLAKSVWDTIFICIWGRRLFTKILMHNVQPFENTSIYVPICTWWCNIPIYLRPLCCKLHMIYARKVNKVFKSNTVATGEVRSDNFYNIIYSRSIFLCAILCWWYFLHFSETYIYI